MKRLFVFPCFHSRNKRLKFSFCTLIPVKIHDFVCLLEFFPKQNLFLWNKIVNECWSFTAWQTRWRTSWEFSSTIELIHHIIPYKALAIHVLSFFSYVLFVAANYYPKAYLMYPSKKFFDYFDDWFFHCQLLHLSAFLLLLYGHQKVVI